MDSASSQIQSTQPKDPIHQNILSQLLFTYKRPLYVVLLVFARNLSGFANCLFSFHTVFPLNMFLYQLSYSPGNWWFTIQQKKDGILHDLFIWWRCKSCANSLTISLKRIVVINHGILCQSQSQVTATLPTKHWLTKKSRRCILHVHLLGNY